MLISSELFLQGYEKCLLTEYQYVTTMWANRIIVNNKYLQEENLYRKVYTNVWSCQFFFVILQQKRTDDEKIVLYEGYWLAVYWIVVSGLQAAR